MTSAITMTHTAGLVWPHISHELTLLLKSHTMTSRMTMTSSITNDAHRPCSNIDVTPHISRTHTATDVTDDNDVTEANDVNNQNVFGQPNDVSQIFNAIQVSGDSHSPYCQVSMRKLTSLPPQMSKKPLLFIHNNDQMTILQYVILRWLTIFWCRRILLSSRARPRAHRAEVPDTTMLPLYFPDYIR